MSYSIVVDADIQAVVEFMQTKVAAGRLVAVANGLAAMAPLLWGTYQPEPVQALRLDVVAMPSALQKAMTSRRRRKRSWRR